MPYLLSVVGPIGSGKSTAVRHLERMSTPDQLIIRIAEEPVAEWIEDSMPDGSNFSWLKSFYEDQKRWAFSFQMKVLVTVTASLKLQMHLAAEEERRTGVPVIVVTERTCLDGQHIFMVNAMRKGYIDQSEYKLYCEMLMLLESPKPDDVLFVHTSSGTCYTRIMTRQRVGEATNLTASYCEAITSLYDDALSKGSLGAPEHTCVVVDNDADYEDFLVRVRRGLCSMYPALTTHLSPSTFRGALVVEEVVERRKLSVGSRVRVADHIKKPVYGWGTVTTDQIGIVSSIIESPARLVSVDWPGQKDWTGLATELIIEAE